ncbi:MAG: hypothetical protein KC423_08910 [Anaerolineales bacterium]|nr:hypothetical protein [Anaerolineales bacterium]
MTIAEYLAAVKSRLLIDPIIADFQVTRERSTLTDGYLRTRLTLLDNGFLEFSEYVQRTTDGQINVVTYSYHWADAAGNLVCRWDNVPHFPNLPNFPHHIHNGQTGEVSAGQAVDIFKILDEIANALL